MSLPPDGREWMSDRDMYPGKIGAADDPYVCWWCQNGAHSNCMGLRCDCSGRYGRTAATHGPYQGPVRLVIDDAPIATPNDVEDFDEWLKRQLPNK